MTRKQKHKRLEFVKLCSSLTKQGYNFVKEGIGRLSFDKHTALEVMCNDSIKRPFTDSITLVSVGNKKAILKFNQWSDRNIF